MKYRKKPVVIEAWLVNELLYFSESHWTSLPQSVINEYEKGNVIFADNHIEIKTLEGWHRGNFDDMIIEGVAGELYPCKPDIFQQAYELVKETQ